MTSPGRGIGIWATICVIGLGLFLVGHGIHVMRTGVMGMEGPSVEREDTPIAFWTLVLMEIFLGALLLFNAVFPAE